ncbi:MAG TPA: glycogen/starch synthase [Pontiellaceae bacterium]|nr:glycogen/starch synthase [Pontiellaceae bacterium]HPR83495.1 glycogen/starch synthase [Pontiellaceae bacterium]
MNNPLNILMVAAENDGIARCKVGGIGDVIRDIPAALADLGGRTSIVTPSYGFLHELGGSTRVAEIRFPFAGHSDQAVLYRVRPRTEAAARSVHYVIDHPAFLHYNAEKEQYDIYSNDPLGRPFATDATKFACFCAAVAAAIKENLFGPLNVLHLHDWHAAFLLLLRKYDTGYASLKKLRTVYTIHNLALQGIRPLSGDRSSLESWYPDINFGTEIPGELRDPRWIDCINPMAVGIRLSDAVQTVSPSYAEEILMPSRPPQFFGGEGLDRDLQRAAAEGRLHGILNGCEYPPARPAKKSVRELLSLVKSETAHWAARRTALSFADFTAFKTLDKLEAARSKPSFIATSVSRVVDQKMLLLKAPGSDGVSGLEKILQIIGSKGLYILLGTGDRDTEAFLAETAATHSNFLFLNSYSNKVADALYASGDLFLMPSSFEPCGIGQMLAMRDGQPCLVHRTGGLRDTVQPGINGFGFEGETLHKQIDAMAAALKAAVQLHAEPEKWQAVCNAASDARFLWSDSAKQYIQKLYSW